MPPTVHVVAAIIHDAGLVLACRRAPHKTAAGQWEFPGGKVEPDESPEAALAREIREELSVEVVVGALVDRSTTVVGEIDIDLACYDARLVGPRPTASTDHDRLEWRRPAELHDLDWAEPDLPAVRRVAARRPSASNTAARVRPLRHRK